MFTYDAVIDAVQTSKKQMVNTFVTNKTVADALNEFVDTQSTYTKKLVKSSVDAATTVSQEMVKSMQEMSKLDPSKFAELYVKAYQDLTKSVKS